MIIWPLVHLVRQCACVCRRYVSVCSDALSSWASSVRGNVNMGPRPSSIGPQSLGSCSLEPRPQSSSWHVVTVKVPLGSPHGEWQENVCVMQRKWTRDTGGGFFLATRKAQFIKDLMDNSILFFFHFGYNFCSLGHFCYETQQCIYNHIWPASVRKMFADHAAV